MQRWIGAKGARPYGRNATANNLIRGSFIDHRCFGVWKVLPRVVLVMLFSLLDGVVVEAAPPSPAAGAEEPSVEERLASLDPASLSPTRVEQARLELESARLRMEGVQLDRKGAEGAVAVLKEALKEGRAALAALRASPRNEEGYRKRLAEEEEASLRRQQELEKEQGRLQTLMEQELRTREALSAARRWYEGLEAAWRGFQERSRREAFADVEARLLAEEQRFQLRARELSEQLAALPAEAEEQRSRLAVEATDAEERSRLQRVMLRRHRLVERLDSLRAAPTAEEAAQVERLLAELEGVAADFAEGGRLLIEKVGLIEQQRALLEKRRGLHGKGGAKGQEEKRLNGLISALREEAARHQALLAEAEKLRAAQAERRDRMVSRGLEVRHRLPLSDEAREAVSDELARAPGFVLHYLAEVLNTLAIGLAAVGIGSWLLVGAAFAALLAGARRLRALLLSRAVGRLPESTLELLAELMLRLLPWLVVLSLFSLLVYLAQPPLSQLRLLLILAGLWLAIAAAKGLGWLFLVLPRGESAEARPRLYAALVRVAWVGGGVATLLLIAHWSALPQGVLDLLDRAFFVLLLFAVPLVSSIRAHIDSGLTEHYTGRFWLPAARLLLLLVPLLVLFAAVAGVVGYLNLSRALLGSVGWVAAVSAGWLFSVGLLRDAANGLKNLAVSRSRHGLLWAQGVIDPARKLGNLLLMLGAFVVLFRLLGWGADSAAVKGLRALLELPLVKVGETQILVEGVLVSLLVLMVVVWLGHWAREITYRWLYTPVTDLGIRQSLSVFTQYAVVVVGGVIALQALDIDLTAFAVFAGALGVGLGLGLQGVANNFVSGLLLLAERPLRTGDMVNIGGTEGEVTRFGIRSLTIKTWDNQEMIIPNAEVVSSSFTNWTHSDNVMRTMFIVGVSYDDDPHRVKRVISEVVAAHPAVLPEPGFKVFLWEFADSSVNFRVQYFTDLRAQGRLDVMSEMLFNIWDVLKANGITIPYPQRDLHVRGWPSPPDAAFERKNDRSEGDV